MTRVKMEVVVVHGAERGSRLAGCEQGLLGAHRLRQAEACWDRLHTRLAMNGHAVHSGFPVRTCLRLSSVQQDPGPGDAVRTRNFAALCLLSGNQRRLPNAHPMPSIRFARARCSAHDDGLSSPQKFKAASHCLSARRARGVSAVAAIAEGGEVEFSPRSLFPTHCSPACGLGDF